MQGIFPFSKTSRLALRLTQTPLQLLKGTRPACEVDQWPYPLQRLRMMMYLCIPITFIAFTGATAQHHKNSTYLYVTMHNLSSTSFFLFVIFYLFFVLCFFFLFASLHSFINLSSIFSSLITYICPYSLHLSFTVFNFVPEFSSLVLTAEIVFS